jgi:hypothetical protein
MHYALQLPHTLHNIYMQLEADNHMLLRCFQLTRLEHLTELY